MTLDPRNDFEPLPSSSLRLRLNYWVLTHFSTIRRAAIAALTVAIVALYGWAAWKAVPILRDPKLVSRIADEVAAMRPFIPVAPQQLELGEVSAVATPNSTQLLATISNPNDDAVAKDVAYEFRRPSGDVVASGRTWLMPGETRYAAGVSTAEADDAELRVASLRWERQRSNDPVLPLQLSVRDVGLEYESGQPSRASFVAVNGDSVGYRTVTAIAVARMGGSTVAVGTLTLANLAPGEERPSAVTWYHVVPSGAQVEVQLVTDPFDRGNVLLNE